MQMAKEWGPNITNWLVLDRLDDNMEVKVADFGLSRDIYVKEYYSSEDRKTKMPVKWMAPESLTRAVYTTKSDVVSYIRKTWETTKSGVES